MPPSHSVSGPSASGAPHCHSAVVVSQVMSVQTPSSSRSILIRAPRMTVPPSGDGGMVSAPATVAMAVVVPARGCGDGGTVTVRLANATDAPGMDPSRTTSATRR